jgi:hypothetical protein
MGACWACGGPTRARFRDGREASVRCLRRCKQRLPDSGTRVFVRNIGSYIPQAIAERLRQHPNVSRVSVQSDQYGDREARRT